VADLVSTLTSHVKLLGVGIGAAVLFGGTATTISLADTATPSPSPATHPAPQANPHATATKKPKAADNEDADDKDEPGGVRPTDTHGYCVSTAVAAAHKAGKTGRDIAAAAHSCGKPGKSHGKSAAAPGHTKG
jgi:hypothetical protein